MNKIRMIAICISLLATLSMVGCMCTPGYYSGMSPCGYGAGSVSCGDTCDPCGPVEMGCGVIECGPNYCVPSRIVDCQTNFSNIGNGICLIGRGLLDAAATPFIVIGKVLSSGCRYEVSVNCASPYQMQDVADPCVPCGTVGTSGCDNCAGGYSEGIQYNTSTQNRVVPSISRKNNSVVQASYQEPTAPVVRFVQPR